jgi:hypothetical protein
MERRNFLFTVCGVGAAVGALKLAAGERQTDPAARCKVINRTERTIYMKLVSAVPGLDSNPPRGGILFPEEEYFDNLGEGTRVAIVWDHTGEKVLTMKPIKVYTPCRIDVYEGDVTVTYEV